MGDAPVLSHCSFLKKILDENRPVYWSIVVKEKPTAGSPFFGAFPSDGIPKATNNINVHFLLTVTIPATDTSQFRENFEATKCIS